MPRVSKSSASQEQQVEGIVHERAEELDGYTDDGVIMKNLQAASEQA